MKFVRSSLSLLPLALAAAICALPAAALAQGAPPPASVPVAKPSVWARVTVSAPVQAKWRLNIIAHNPPYGAAKSLWAGQTTSEKPEEVGWMAAGAPSAWIDMAPLLTGGGGVGALCVRDRPGE